MTATDANETPGDAHGRWFWCFKHKTAERKEDCRQMDRMGPYPTKEDAEHWQDRVNARNEVWDEQDEEEED